MLVVPWGEPTLSDCISRAFCSFLGPPPVRARALVHAWDGVMEGTRSGIESEERVAFLGEIREASEVWFPQSQDESSRGKGCVAVEAEPVP